MEQYENKYNKKPETPVVRTLPKFDVHYLRTLQEVSNGNRVRALEDLTDNKVISMQSIQKK